MHIIIVGGGIAGLSTYLHLRKHLSTEIPHRISIYESHIPRSNITSSSSTLDFNALSESTAIVGGGLGISPNGMRVLRDLDIELHDAVVKQGFRAEKFVFKGANGWTLGVNGTGDGIVTRQGDGDKEEVCIASSRHGLWQTIERHVREKYGDVIEYRKVIGVQKNKERAGKVVVNSIGANGEEKSEEVDLVIGADGVKSQVRKALFGEHVQYDPGYTGQSGVGGFLKTPIPSYITSKAAMVFTFGGNGFFGYSSGGPPAAQQLMWWSTFETSSLPDPGNIDLQVVKIALQDRHKHWKDPVIQQIIQDAEVESLYPTWALPELPHWGEDGIVLLGDAAHAMDPTTGQGASQALEDSQTFALLLSRLLDVSERKTTSDKHVIAEAVKMFHAIRSPRTRKIVERGKKLAGNKSNVGIVGEHFMYGFLWLLNTFPAVGKMVLGDVNQELYGWSAAEEVDKAMKKRCA